MFDRKLIHNLILTAADAVYFYVLESTSKSSFERKLSVGLGFVLLLIIWSKWLSRYHARLAASGPCCMGAFFIYFLIEHGRKDLGTFFGAAGFLVGLIGLVFKLRSKAKPNDG